MQAGLVVLAEDGWERFTMARACELAGVSVGMLYRRFENRDAFVDALRERWFANIEAAQRELLDTPVDWSGMRFDEALATAVAGVVGGIAAEERLLALWASHERLDEPGVARFSAVARNFSGWFVGGLMHHRDAIAHDPAEPAAQLCVRMVIDMAVRRANYGDEFATGTTVGDWGAFTVALTAMARAYLNSPS
jgi:AcrR family transcriptional regulator